jgi:uncharacterized membrane protein (UPF0127 family)
MRAATIRPLILHALCLLLLATIAVIQVPARAAEPSDLLREFGRGQLIIDTTQSGCVLFDIYIATSNKQRSQGLMHIRSMGTHEGMLFLYNQPRQISMWMKNTLIPLDMLFISTDAKIASIHENAEVLSEAIIQSSTNVIGVLELNAGAAKLFGIIPGDQLIFPTG